MKLFVILGAINALIAVACGAFGAHALEAKLEQHYLDIWETAVKYQFYHALGLIAIGILIQVTGAQFLTAAGWFMLAGIIFFTGSLMVLALSGVSILGAVTPIGGVMFLISWILVIIGIAKL
ncbi:DUF423 domain-containing protein [Jeotgalicoccus sp. S0W5]|mgnify:FL=1|uniref:DUF423 domain-containing protein n=1 Tax=Jeotgalicoccus sp. S0W5 TaxID=2527874 RepID=UPI0014150762|nr:DUF423 domain-containing protein [Jeotgalicoccus sp. S0W5]